ncbi:MAG: diguanylate cyclase, partial [Microcystaceae cyanobacterium]
SQRWIQRIADATPNLLYIYDIIEQRHVYVNREIAVILGYAPEEIQSMGTDLVCSLIHPSDLKKFSDYLQKFETAQEDDIFEIEYRVRDGGGQWRWLSSRDTLFSRTLDGKPKQILGTATDITERKQVEEALQQTNQKLTSKVRELEQRHQEMTLLSDMIDFLQACLTVEEAYTALIEFLQPLFPNSNGGIWMLNSANNLVEAVASWGTSIHSETCFPFGDCWALRRGRLHHVKQTTPGLFCQHTHDNPSPSESLCVPMIAQGETLGLFYLDTSEPEQLTAVKQQLARTVAEQIALALANLKLRETLQNQSLHDALTGLFNRRYLDEFLKREIHRAARGEKPLGIIMLDVDHFRHFNNTFGHEAGDEVLKELARFLQSSIRASDMVCRFGGEELLLILPKASLEDTRKRAEQIRQGIKQLNVKKKNRPLGNITVSLGVACFPIHGQTGREVLRSADLALLKA